MSILDNYIKNLEDLLKDKIKEFEVWADKEIKNLKNLTDVEKNEYIDSISDEYHQLSKAFPNILRSSLFISCYSIFEYGLLSLCEHVQKKRNHKKKFNKYKGKGIERAKNYLEDVYEIDFTKQIPSWNIINNYRLIRNFIVHKQGRIDIKKKKKGGKKKNNVVKVKEFINKNKNWIFLDNNRIQFNKGFFKEVKKTIEDFSDELSKILP